MARKKKIKIIEPEEILDSEFGELPEEPPKEKQSLYDEVEIMPNRDFRITHNQYDIIIEKGVPVTIPRLFLQNMVTEKVIEKIPK